MFLLEAGDARTVIAPEGAELQLWDIAGRPLIWKPDPAFWPQTAPILFPVVGWTRNGQERVGGRSYPLGLHGFAMHRRFEMVTHDKSSVRLHLGSDAATRTLYPFDFSFTVEHRLTENSLSMTLEVENTGEVTMPYACGVHPGFRWPFAGDAANTYRIRFDVPEDPVVPEIAPGGFISPRKKVLPLEGRILPLKAALFQNDALCFLNARSRGLRFEAPNGAAIGLETEEFPHLALWCRPGGGFLCLEAWTGYSDPEDFDGDLFAKPSMRLLTPGAAGRHKATYTYRPAPADA
jgi:galactose mutarotase-like enzyme